MIDQLIAQDGKDNSVHTFWETELAKEYKRVSENLLLSNRPAYALAYHLLGVPGNVVLDFGCFQGDSSTRIHSLGAEYVYGVDINPEFIQMARSKYANIPNLGFETISNDDPIVLPEGRKVKRASATFVWPTVPLKELLEKSMRQISGALEEGGRLVMLSLHENSFYGDYDFYNYAHKLPQRGLYQDGVPFPNELKLNDGTQLAFNDYCWTHETITNLLLENGFSNVSLIDVTFDLPGLEGEVLRKEIEKVKVENGVDFSVRPEFKVPLYQIVIADK